MIWFYALDKEEKQRQWKKKTSNFTRDSAVKCEVKGGKVEKKELVENTVHRSDSLRRRGKAKAASFISGKASSSNQLPAATASENESSRRKRRT